DDRSVKSMKAIVVHEYGGPERLKLEEVADPKPGAGEVLVRIRAAGVNPVDAYIHTGTYVRKPPLPYTPGFDGAGEVEAIGDGGTDAGLAIVREHGADVTVNHRADSYTDEIKKAAGGRGVDVIIEMAAHINLDRDLGLLARNGRVVTVGNRGRVEINPRDAMGRDAAILGMTLFNVSDADFVEIHAAIIAGLTNGTLNPVIGGEMPLGDAARAHEAVMGPGGRVKIVTIAQA